MKTVPSLFFHFLRVSASAPNIFLTTPMGIKTVKKRIVRIRFDITCPRSSASPNHMTASGVKTTGRVMVKTRTTMAGRAQVALAVNHVTSNRIRTAAKPVSLGLLSMFFNLSPRFGVLSVVWTIVS